MREIMSLKKIAAGVAVMGLALGGAIAMAERSSATSADAATATRVIHLERIAVKGDLRLLARPRISAAASQIINANSGKCLEVYRSQIRNRARVVQYSCNGTQTQSWRFGLVGSFHGHPVYQLINANSGKCASVYRASRRNGAPVIQYTCRRVRNQYWIETVVNGYYVYINYNSRKALEVFRSSTAEHGKVVQWRKNGSLTQSWLVQTPGVLRVGAWCLARAGRFSRGFLDALAVGAPPGGLVRWQVGAVGRQPGRPVDTRLPYSPPLEPSSGCSPGRGPRPGTPDGRQERGR